METRPRYNNVILERNSLFAWLGGVSKLTSELWGGFSSARALPPGHTGAVFTCWITLHLLLTTSPTSTSICHNKWCGAVQKEAACVRATKSEYVMVEMSACLTFSLICGWKWLQIDSIWSYFKFQDDFRGQELAHTANWDFSPPFLLDNAFIWPLYFFSFFQNMDFYVRAAAGEGVL